VCKDVLRVVVPVCVFLPPFPCVFFFFVLGFVFLGVGVVGRFRGVRRDPSPPHKIVPPRRTGVRFLKLSLLATFRSISYIVVP